MQNSITMLENNFAVTLKVRNIQPYNQIIPSLGMNSSLKKPVSPQRFDEKTFISHICNTQNWKQYKYPLPDKWINRYWCIQTTILIYYHTNIH